MFGTEKRLILWWIKKCTFISMQKLLSGDDNLY